MHASFLPLLQEGKTFPILYVLAFNVQRVAKKCLNKKYFSPKFHHKCILKTKKLIKISGRKLLWNF